MGYFTSYLKKKSSDSIACVTCNVSPPTLILRIFHNVNVCIFVLYIVFTVIYQKIVSTVSMRHLLNISQAPNF